MGILIRFVYLADLTTKMGHVVAGQLRAVDRERLVKRLGILPDATLIEVLSVLQAMFAV